MLLRLSPKKPNTRMMRGYLSKPVGKRGPGTARPSQAREVLESITFIWIEAFERVKQERPAIKGIRSHFMYSAIDANHIAVREFSCYCKHCEEETWIGPHAAACAALKCASITETGPWTVVETTLEGRRGYSARQTRYLKRGRKLAAEISDFVRTTERVSYKCGEDVVGQNELDIDKGSLRPTEHFVAIKCDVMQEGWSFWLARITETLQDATADLKGFRVGDPIVCVQYLWRTSVDDPNNFELGLGEKFEEQFVSVKALRVVDITPDVQPAGVRGIGRRTRSAMRARGPEKTTKVYLSDETLQTIHTAMEQFEAEGFAGRWVVVE
jgi:hypothetical protein